ncbi:MAG TPA: sulfite exporter TauE/SafE family protein [Catalimonadaceae bacterium]|nr:sulfite exporter TauE/SafE family protein [Catalimonadaceae bacterium]
MLFYGLLAGVLGGILGIGGGIIFVIILPGVFSQLGVPDSEIVAYTIANSLFATLFTSLSANFKHARDGNFYWKPILVISIPAVLVGFVFLHFFVNSLSYSKTIYDSLFLVVLFFLFLRMWKRQTQLNSQNSVQQIGPDFLLAGYALTGIGAGTVSSLTGLGGGIFIVPVLHSLVQLPIKKANAVSMGVISITSFSSGLISIAANPEAEIQVSHMGYLVFPVVLFLALGGMVGSFFGVQLSKRMKENWISALFMVFLLVVFILKIRAFL